MNSENFHEYLRNPSMLYQVTYQELKSLALQYPYSPNLRYLLLLKSLLDNHREHDKNLNLAALYSLDRKQLYEAVRAHERVRDLNENYALHEEYLELKDLSNIEEVLENQPLTSADAPIRAQVERLEDAFEKDAISGMDKEGLKTDLGQTDNLEFLENLFEEAEGNAEYGMRNAEFGMRNTEFEPFDENQPQGEVEAVHSGTPETLEEVLGEAAVEPEDTDSAEPIETLEEVPGEAATEPETIELDEPIELLEDALEETAAEPGTATDSQPTISIVGLPIVGQAIEDEPLPTLEEILDQPDPDAFSYPETPLAIATDRPQPIKPAPKTTFGSWQRTALNAGSLLGSHLKPAVAPAVTPIVESKPAPVPMPRNEAKTLAAKSITEDTGIASEPLAAILEAQGHSERAIAMYEKLILLHPEKSSFFAAKIEKLKN